MGEQIVLEVMEQWKTTVRTLQSKAVAWLERKQVEAKARRRGW